MRHKRSAFLLLVTFLISIPVAAQQPPQRDPQAVAILARSYAVMGGTAVQGVSDLTLSGQILGQETEGAVQGTIVFKLAGRNRHRVDVMLPNRSFSQVVNGNRASRTENGKDQRLPYHTILNSCPDLFPILSELADWNDPSFRAIYVGIESLGGRSVEHIRIEKQFSRETVAKGKLLSNIAGADLYIDSATLQLVKRARQVPSVADLKATVLVEQTFSDYRLGGGVLVPYQVTTHVRGQKISEIAFTSVVFNTGLSSAEFEVKP